jgi:hypothetical protein
MYNIWENTPRRSSLGKYQPMAYLGKNMKRKKEKGGKCCIIRNTEERKERIEAKREKIENEKKGQKSV